MVLGATFPPIVSHLPSRWQLLQLLTWAIKSGKIIVPCIFNFSSWKQDSQLYPKPQPSNSWGGLFPGLFPSLPPFPSSPKIVTLNQSCCILRADKGVLWGFRGGVLLLVQHLVTNDPNTLRFGPLGEFHSRFFWNERFSLVAARYKPGVSSAYGIVKCWLMACFLLSFLFCLSLFLCPILLFPLKVLAVRWFSGPNRGWEARSSSMWVWASHFNISILFVQLCETLNCCCDAPWEL